MYYTSQVMTKLISILSLSISLASPLPRSHSTIFVAAVEAAVVVEPFLSFLLH